MRSKSLLIFLLILGGCAANRLTTARKYISVQDIYKAKCSLCHSLLKPKDYHFAELDAYVKKYTKDLTVEEREALSKFLKENAKE